MLNHASRGSENLVWDWDIVIPYRIIIRACQNFGKGERLCLPHARNVFKPTTASQVLYGL